jgi:HSP20 family molecular chaperone IbpA
MADIMRRQSGGSPMRSVFGDVFGFDPFSLLARNDFGVEVRRTDRGYELDIPMPGFRPEDVSITIEDRVVTIEGKNERRRFTRSITLPDEVNEDAIEARVQHGMLTVMLPLQPKAQPRRIAVQVAGGGGNGQGQGQGQPAMSGGTAIDGTAETTGT